MSGKKNSGRAASLCLFFAPRIRTPEEYRDPRHRFPVMSYHNSEIKTLMRADSDEALLLSVLRRVFLWETSHEEVITKTPTEIAKEIQRSEAATLKERAKFNNEITIGKILSRIEREWPNDTAKLSRCGKERNWTIKLSDPSDF
jgi:hypothetical protein